MNLKAASPTFKTNPSPWRDRTRAEAPVYHAIRAIGQPSPLVARSENVALVPKVKRDSTPQGPLDDSDPPRAIQDSVRHSEPLRFSDSDLYIANPRGHHDVRLPRASMAGHTADHHHARTDAVSWRMNRHWWISLVGLSLLSLTESMAGDDHEGSRMRPHITIRGIYGGVPTQILDRGESLADHGINAVWIGSGGLTRDRVELLKNQGAKVFAEFNSMHDASYLKAHPDAAPVGPDGKPSPPPDGWQGLCPTHPGYRRARMDAFRKALAEFEIDGIWLDYHHAHASWEQAIPKLPDTCFCERCLKQFERDTGIDLPERATSELASMLLGPHRSEWVRWRCDVFTDWVREYHDIRNEVRPGALLGTFHCPWTDTERDGALREKLAIDLKVQAKYLDVFSPMPYHARFGHANDPAWISRQVAWLGEYLGVEGKPDEHWKIWPIVQLSDWGETVPASQVAEVMDHGTRRPATGVLVFAWGSLHQNWDKVEELSRAYRTFRP